MNCPKPSLILEENIRAWELFTKLYDNTQPDGMTGVTLADLSNFHMFADMEGMCLREKQDVLAKITLIHRIIKEVKAAEHKENVGSEATDT